MHTIQYITEWATPYFSSSRYDLANSGLPEDPVAVPMVSRDSQWINADAGKVMEDIKHKIASFYENARPDQVELMMGASGGLFITAFLMSQFDKPVVVETPVYEPIWRGYEALGMDIRWLNRKRDKKYSLKYCIDEAKDIIKGASCLAITNPNNPTGMYDEPEVIKELAEAIYPAYLIINEAYLPFIDGKRSAFGLADNVVIVMTMTKSFGFGIPRMGWVVVPESLMKDLIPARVLLMGGHSAIVAAYALPVLNNLENRKKQVRAHMQGRHDLVFKAIREHPRISWHEPVRNLIIGSIKIDGVDDDLTFCRRILEEHGVIMGPGYFFREPGTIRIGIGSKPEKFDKGFEILLDYANKY
jgi:aspartate/methionine/tyrosine aminotransferase